MSEKLIEMKIKRSGNKGFTCYFPSLQDARNFSELIRTIVDNVKKEAEKK